MTVFTALAIVLIKMLANTNPATNPRMAHVAGTVSGETEFANNS
jgi:hypothetical protein